MISSEDLKKFINSDEEILTKDASLVKPMLPDHNEKMASDVEPNQLHIVSLTRPQTNPENSYLLAKSCFLDGKINEAISYLKQYIELEYNTEKFEEVSYAFDLLGQCYEARQENASVASCQEAIDCYTKAVELNPFCATALNNCGLLYIKAAQYCLEQDEQQDKEQALNLLPKAQEFLLNALKLCYDNPIFLQSVASWHEKYTDVLKELMEQSDADQEEINTHFVLAIEYYQKSLERCKKEDQILEKIIISNLTECFAQYGHHFYRKENYFRAQEFYAKAIELDSDHLTAISQMGMCLFKRDIFIDARRYFATIIKKTNDIQEVADAWANISCCYRFEKNWDEAGKTIAFALELAPNDEAILEEAKKLEESRPGLQASRINVPQAYFGTKNPVPDSRKNTEIGGSVKLGSL